jgi:hypothetical protein
MTDSMQPPAEPEGGEPSDVPVSSIPPPVNPAVSEAVEHSDNVVSATRSSGNFMAVEPRGAELQGEVVAVEPRGAELQGEALAVEPRGAELQGEPLAVEPRGAELQGEPLAVEPRGPERVEAHPKPSGIYTPAPATGSLQQGDILTGVTEWIFAEISEDGAPIFDRQPHPFVVVLSQSCDLEWDHAARTKGEKTSDKCLATILLAPAFAAELVRGRKGDGLINSEKWNRIKKNNEERFHFFECVPTHEDTDSLGLPELVVDFKQYFSVAAPDLYRQIAGSAKRRARLLNPYLEHLATRFFNFQARVATPRPHFSAT